MPKDKLKPIPEYAWQGLIKALIDERWSFSTNDADKDLSIFVGDWNES